MTPQSYNGDERRSQTVKDHDNLIEVITILAQHVKNFDTHVESNELDFANLIASVDRLKFYVYIGVGIAVAVQVLPAFFGMLQSVAHATGK